MKNRIEKWTNTSWLYSMAHDDTDSNKGADIKAVKQTNNDTNDEAIENVLTAAFVGGLVALGFLFGIMDGALSSSSELDKNFRKACYQHNHGWRYSRPKH